jgi:signal transduction histidine kinase/ligand-binding sensor domain-containing protein
MSTKILLLLLLCSCINKLQSQNIFQQLKLQHWNTKQGMPTDLVLNVYQTRDGFIYMTGYAGLIRFDGINFTAFNSRNNPLMKTDNIESIITETADSTLWIPTNASGLLAFKNGRLSQYLKDMNGLLFIDKSKKDQLLLIRGRGSGRYVLFDTHTKTSTELNTAEVLDLYKKEALVTDHRKDKSGTQWQRVSGLLYRIREGNAYELSAKEGLNKKGPFYFYVDSKDRVWLSSGEGLLIWDGKRFRFFPGMEGKAMEPTNNSAGLMCEDKRGGIWAVTQSGLAYLAQNSDHFIFNPPSSPFSTLFLNNVLEDKEGDLFFSSDGGLYQLSISKVINYTKEDGFINNRITGVCAVDSSRYVVANKGKLFLIEDGKVQSYPLKNKKLNEGFQEVLYVCRDHKGNIWACYGSGKIVEISKDGERVYQTDGEVRFAYEDEQNKMWFGLPYRGIGFINEKDSFEYANFPGIDFKTLYLSSIHKLRNHQWLVTAFNKPAFVIDERGHSHPLTNAPADNSVGQFTILEDPDGTIWLATQAGIARYKSNKYSSVDAQAGLPENTLFDILPDYERYLWFPTNRGLIRAQKQELNDYLDKKITSIHWEVYDEGDGMNSQQCVGARHSAVTLGGKVLISTYGGLVEIDPAKLTRNIVPPPVVIHRVLKDDEVVDFTKVNSFAPGNSRYVFEFSGLSLAAPEKVKFKFRLTGYDKGWITSVGDRKAFYTNLPAGNYTFQVIAANNDGVWNKTGAKFSFTVKPFFYETWWFLLLMGCLLLTIVWLIIRWRTQATRKQNEFLEAQVQQRTVEVQHSLEELRATQAQLVQSEKMASLGELTAGIAHEIQNPLNFVNNFSEVSVELADEMEDALQKNDKQEAIVIASDIKENLQKIQHHGKRADAIVKGMLQHSRANSGKKEPTDINALADEYLRLSYHGLRAKDKDFNANFATDFDKTIGKLDIVPEDIGRVLLNLYNNAFYSVNEKKKQLNSSFEPRVWVTTKRFSSPSGAGGLEISVKDNGTGIPQKVLDKIYQPFFTTKPTGQGTGLGLSLSYDIIKAHGGEMKVESTEGKGAEFKIILP